MNKLAIAPLITLALLGGCRDNDDNGMTNRSSDSTLSRSGTQNDSSRYRSESQILSLIQQKNRQEIEVGRMANSKAVSNEARTLAMMLVDDHTQSQRDIRQLADRLSIKVTDSMQPNQQGQSDHGNHADRLSNLGGTDFDREFGRMMVQGHADLIAQIDQARSHISNTQVRDLLDRTIQQLRKHEEQARRISGVQG